MRATFSAFGGRRGQAVLRLVGAGSLAVMLAGCYQTAAPGPVAENHYPMDYRQRHPITLQQGVRSVKVFINRNRGGLTATERADVLAFAQQWRHEAMSGIIIDVPQGGGVDRAATATTHEIQSIFAASGVPRRAVYVHHYRPAPTALTSIRLNYARLTANAGPCGIWPNDLGPAAGKVYLENRPYWNLGCATQHNLAVMVANPSDLAQPRVAQPPYQERRSKVLDAYAKGESPSAKYPGYTSGTISELGK